MKTDPSKALKDLNQEGTSFNLKDLLFKYLHFYWLFILCLILAGTCAWLYLRYTKPLYSVSSTLLIRNEQSKGGTTGGQENMFSDIALFQSNTNKQNEIQILSSRTLMERVVKELNLQVGYFAEGTVKTTNLYHVNPFRLEIINQADSTKAFGFQINLKDDRTFQLNEENQSYFFGQEIEMAGVKFKLVPTTNGTLTQRKYRVVWMPSTNAASKYAGGLSVIPANDMSTVLSLSYVTEDPKLGADILNQLVIEYNSAAIEDKNEINRKILAFITDRLNLVENQLQNVESDLQRYKSNQQVFDLQSQSQLYFGNKSELDKNIIQQELQLQIAGLVEDYINQPKNRFTLVPSTLGLTDPTLLELIAGYNTLASERITELQTGATPNNPVIKKIENDIEEARLKILANLTNIKKAYRNTIESLTNQSNLLRKEIALIPEKELIGREKTRQQEIKQNLYLYLLQKREESEIAQASVVSSSRVIDKALPTYSRVGPIPARIYSIAWLVGLVVPVVIIFLIEMLNDRVTTKADIEKVTNVPIMAEIGHSEGEKVLLFPRKTKGIIAEQFRILRSNMKFLLNEIKGSQVILITSSFSGEGKSFISTNIGAAFAVSGQRTVILEFDLRKPKIVSGLKLQKSQGLTNYLVGAVKLEDLPTPVPEVEGLYVIPCGPVPPNPSELLLTSQIGELFQWLRQNFDLVVIDTAPVGLVSDAMNLGQYADATLYVVRQRYTFKKQLQFIDELYRERKLPRLGLLVNDVVMKGARGYYGYGGGRYGYGYGYGYGYAQNNGYYEDEKKTSWWKRLGRKSQKA